MTMPGEPCQKARVCGGRPWPAGEPACFRRGCGGLPEFHAVRPCRSNVLRIPGRQRCVPDSSADACLRGSNVHWSSASGRTRRPSRLPDSAGIPAGTIPPLARRDARLQRPCSSVWSPTTGLSARYYFKYLTLAIRYVNATQGRGRRFPTVLARERAGCPSVAICRKSRFHLSLCAALVKGGRESRPAPSRGWAGRTGSFRQ